MVDGNIVAARTRLGRAVQRLTAPRPAVYHDRTVYAPSLYSCLLEDVAGTQGDTHTPAKSIPPIWMDASQLRIDIDSQTVKWLPVPGTTPERLQLLSAKTFRPQDFDHISAIANQIDQWCEAIMNMIIDPERKWFIEGKACPSCTTVWVRKKDPAGETVRVPSLKLTTNVGCTCQACKAFWPEQNFMFLARLLGCATPDGIAEDYVLPGS